MKKKTVKILSLSVLKMGVQFRERAVEATFSDKTYTYTVKDGSRNKRQKLERLGLISVFDFDSTFSVVGHCLEGEEAEMIARMRFKLAELIKLSIVHTKELLAYQERLRIIFLEWKLSEQPITGDGAAK